MHQPREGRGRNWQVPPKNKKRKPTNSTDEKKGGGKRQTHSCEAAHPPQKRQANSPASNTDRDTHAAPRKNTRGPPYRTRRHRTESSCQAEERTRRHTTHWRSGGQKKMGAAQTKGEGGTGTKRHKTRTGSGGHHKATTRQGLKPWPPPRSPNAKYKRGGGGQTPLAATPANLTPNGRGARNGPHAPAPKQEKGQSAGKAQTHTHTPRTSARRGGAGPKPVSKHTHRRPQPGVARLPLNPTPNARTTKPSQKLQGKAET